jgi:chromate transporter
LTFASLLFKVNAVLRVLAALGLGAWLIRPPAGPQQPEKTAVLPPARPVSRARWTATAAVITAVLAVVALAWALPSDVGALGLALFKIGAVAFGNGMTIVPSSRPTWWIPTIG